MSLQTQMKDYPYSLYSASRNSYGELTADYESSSFVPLGTVRIAINISNQATNNYITYSEAEYIGLTKDSIADNYIIHYGNEKLKVKYVNPIGRYKQVALARI